MKVLLISYDLMSPGQSYQPIYDYLEDFPQWTKPLRSLYLIVTNKTVSTVRDELKNIVDSNDKVMVINISNSAWASYKLPAMARFLETHA